MEANRAGIGKKASQIKPKTSAGQTELSSPLALGKGWHRWITITTVRWCHKDAVGPMSG